MVNVEPENNTINNQTVKLQKNLKFNKKLMLRKSSKYF